MVTSLPLSGVSSDATLRREISNISLAVAKCKKIVVVTGAGISCSCGIPDFRSSDGLYNLVKQQYPDIVLKGRDLFDASLFRDPSSTSVFYTFIARLKQSIDSAEPSPTHHFIKTLDIKGKLLRSYTQNIDGLEERVGLVGSSGDVKGKGKMRAKDVRNVQLHGDIRRVRCTLCSADFPFQEQFTSAFLQGLAPDCPECASRSEARVARSARAIRVGTLRPGIVLYDEPHPLGDDIGTIQTSDLARKPDLLVIMGTSLKVHGLKKLVKEFAKSVHAASPSTTSVSAPLDPQEGKKGRKTGVAALKNKVIFVNKTPPPSEWDGIIDYHIEGDTDAWTDRVLEDWKKMRPADWEVQTTLIENNLFKVEKANALVKSIKIGKSGGRHGQDERDDLENVPPCVVECDKPSRPVKSRASKPSKALENGNGGGTLKITVPKPKTVLDKKTGRKSKHKTETESNSDNVFSVPHHSPTLDSSPSSITSSPMKRRQASSHYSSSDLDIEASPSKRRISHAHVSVPQEERGLLFGVSRRINTKDEVADMSLDNIVHCTTGAMRVSVDINIDDLSRAKREFGRKVESTNSLFGLGGEFARASLGDEEGFELEGDISLASAISVDPVGA